MPNAPAERRESSTFHMFQRVSCSKPESWILLALEGAFGVISAARLSRHVSASIANTRLTLSNSQASRSPAVEAKSVNSDGPVCVVINVQFHHCMVSPARSAFVKTWGWARAKIPAARSPRSVGLKRMETWRPCCSQKSLAPTVLA